MSPIRQASPADLPQLAQIHAQAFERPWTAEALQSLLAGAERLALVADHPDGASGFVLLGAVAGEAEILTLAVSPTHRRMGIGRTLVDAALKAAAHRGAECVWLEAAEDNIPALHLYRAAGFDEAGRRKGYYPRPGAGAADAILLRRILNRSTPSAYAAPP